MLILLYIFHSNMILWRKEDEIWGVVMDNGKKNFGLNEFSMDKRLIMACVLSTLVSVGTVLVITKVSQNYHDKEIQSLVEDNVALESKINSINETLEALDSKIDGIKTECKSSKENSAYLYTTLSSLQKDISIIKTKLNIQNEQHDDKTTNLAPEKKEFIDSFENLIKDGAPFDSFLESNKNKIDMTKYKTTDNLVRFSTQNIKSLSDLKKDYANVGSIVFNTNFEESFWERQKRKITEKISEAITIRKFDEKSSPISNSADNDKTKFEKAGKLLTDEKYEAAINLFNSTKIENESFGNFLKELKKRWNLEKAFLDFKTEYMEKESEPQNDEEKLTKH